MPAAAETPVAALEVVDAVKVWPDGTRALAGVSLTVAAGETLALVGESGSGKTTLLRLFNRLVEPTSGEARVAGQPVSTLEGVEDELFAWSVAIEDNTELRRVLTNRDLTGIARALVVTELLGDRVHPVTVRLAAYAALGGRPRDLLGTLAWLVDRVAESLLR